MRTLLVLPGMNSFSFNIFNSSKLVLPIRQALAFLVLGPLNSFSNKCRYVYGKVLKITRLNHIQFFEMSFGDLPNDSSFTNRRGGHYSGGASAGGQIATTTKAFIVGIILYFVAVAIVYTIGSTNIINNTQINTQIKNVAYFMAVLGTIIGLVAGTVFVLKLLGGL